MCVVELGVLEFSLFLYPSSQQVASEHLEGDGNDQNAKYLAQGIHGSGTELLA